MKKIFNISGDCKPDLHYMVNIEGRLHEIKAMIDRGEYFTINRARQYGKTTILKALKYFLKEEYIVVSLDFQMQMSNAKFKSEHSFSVAFAKAFLKALQNIKTCNTKQILKEIGSLRNAIDTKEETLELVELFEYLSNLCAVSEKPIVLIIDEVDSAVNNQIFLDFLAQLRGYYIARDEMAAFQSVILAGVYDIKNLKRKIRSKEEHKNNSPWNIAAEFTVDMNFSIIDIKGMLKEYERDTQTGMNLEIISILIYEYTSGYPFLVSRICKIIDEKVIKMESYNKETAWTKEGFLEAVKIILLEKNTLFESLVNKLNDYQELKNMLYDILFHGKMIPFNPLNHAIEIAEMFGFVKNGQGMVVITNRIFENIIYSLFLSEEIVNSTIYKAALQDKNQFIQNGYLNMKLVMQKFVEHFSELYGDSEETFIEEVGRKYFLLYLKPIINGIGNYYIEARTRDMRCTDVIVDYRGQQFIIEMKIWHGDEYNRRGEEQLAGYLEDYHLKKGYLLSFNFNKKKQIGIKEIQCGDKLILEAVV